MKKSNPLKTRIKGTKLPDGRLVPPQGLIRNAMLDGELREKFKLLFAKYGVTEGNWKHLAIALAVEHETGFKLESPSRRPRGSSSIWSKEQIHALLLAVEREREANPGKSQLAICQTLASRPPYRGKKTVDALLSKLKREEKQRVLNGD